MVGTGLSVSPDGNYFAFELHQADITANDYRVAWFVASISGETPPINVGDGGDAALFRYSMPNGRPGGAWLAEYARWSPDGRGIAYRKRINGETQIWWSSRDGAENQQWTRSAADVEDFYWSRNGSYLYFETDADRATLRMLEERRYRRGHVYDYDKDWSTIEGRPYYPPYTLTDGLPRVWVLDIESSVERLATDEELAEYAQLKQPSIFLETSLGARKLAHTQNEGAVAWVQPDDPEKQGRSPPLTLYASRHSDGREPVRCPAAECTGVLDLSRLLRDGLVWNSIEDDVLFVRKNGMGYWKRSLYGWRIGEEFVRRILSSDEWISDCSIVQDRAICFRQTPTYPRTIVSIDLANGAIETLVDPNPEFRNLIIGDVELVEWENSSGHGTFGYLVKPPDYVSGRRYPLVIVGYRARRALRGGTGDEYPAHLLAANGFVVLAYEKPIPQQALEIYDDPLDVAKVMWGPDLFDVRMPMSSFASAILVYEEQGLIDPARVAVTGFSAGVGDVNYSLIHSNLFAAAITSGMSFGPNGRVLIGASGESFREYLRTIGAGPYPGPHAFLFPKISLALNPERVTAPLLVNVSDTEHPWALETVVALMENGKPVEMVVYPDEGHVKWQPAHRLSVYERNVDWLNFWLRGLEDPSAEKVPQYLRWRKLREQHIANLEAAGRKHTFPISGESATPQ